MCHLIETIRIENKKLYNLGYHNKRMNNSRKAIFNIYDELNLADYIKIPENISSQRLLCRVVYSDKIHSIKISEYKAREISTIKIVCDDSISYNFKFENRKQLENLFMQKENCDEILIIKNGCVSDTSIHNIIFFNGEKWLTPSTPLLRGTTITRLLDEKKIKERKIKIDDIKYYEKIMLVNAMNDFGKIILGTNIIYY